MSCTPSKPRLTYACLLMCKRPGTSVAACVLCAVCALTQLCGGSGWGPWQLSGRQRPQRVHPSRLQYSSPDRPSCDLVFGISCIGTIFVRILTIGSYFNGTRGMEAVVFSSDGSGAWDGKGGGVRARCMPWGKTRFECCLFSDLCVEHDFISFPTLRVCLDLSTFCLGLCSHLSH